MERSHKLKNQLAKLGEKDENALNPTSEEESE